MNPNTKSSTYLNIQFSQTSSSRSYMSNMYIKERTIIVNVVCGLAYSRSFRVFSYNTMYGFSTKFLIFELICRRLTSTDFLSSLIMVQICFKKYHNIPIICNFFSAFKEHFIRGLIAEKWRNLKFLRGYCLSGIPRTIDTKTFCYFSLFNS